MSPGVLAGLRVLELGSMVAAPYCAKLIADFGADVVKLEPPGAGDPSRRRGPFPNDEPHPERSGLYLYLNTSKRGVTIDLSREEGRALFRDLIVRSDILIEDTAPGSLAALELEYERLAELNPGLIMVSITPFGLTGPYRSYRAYHVNQYHVSGSSLGSYGDQEDEDRNRPPVRGGGHIADYDAGLTASVACMAAVMARKATGRGQHIDVSKQEASMCLERVDVGRSANDPEASSGWGSIGGLMATKDGHIVVTIGADKQWQGLVQAMGEPAWTSEEWCRNELARSQNSKKIQPLIKEWAAGQTTDAIYHGLQSRGTPAGGVLDAAQVQDWAQMRDRGFFVDLDHPVAGRHTYAGSPFRLSTMPWSPGRAPLLGEHNAAVFGDDLGRGAEELERLSRSGVI